jgi:hypothetical protein
MESESNEVRTAEVKVNGAPQETSALKALAKKLVACFSRWSKHPLLVLLLGSLISVYLIPQIISWADEKKALREARVKLGSEFSDRNTEFNSKNNALATLMWQFHTQASLDPDGLKGYQDQFRKEYLARRMALDEMAWWWYRNLETRAKSLNLTAEESNQLQLDLESYAGSVEKTIRALNELSDYLRSNKFCVAATCDRQYEKLYKKMSDEKASQHYFRRDLVIRIYRLLAKPE